jgi:hypothetical protein
VRSSASLLADFEAEIERTRGGSEPVPADRFDWKPRPKSMSLGQLDGHLEENPSWAHAMMEDEMDFAATASSYRPFAPRERADLLAAFERAAATERTVRPLCPAFWGTAWTAGTWCELRSDFRDFRPDRMRGVELLPSRLEDEPGRDLRAPAPPAGRSRTPRGMRASGVAPAEAAFAPLGTARNRGLNDGGPSPRRTGGGRG